jgi:hypothetical protein
MSKKLIAAAAAAALALTALVGVAPASAATFEVAVSNTTGNSPAQTAASKAADGVTAATAYNVNVPSNDVIRSNATGDRSGTTALKFDITTTAARGQVDVTATGSVRIITEDEFDDGAKVATGKTSLTDFSAANAFTFYVITTSTSAGTVVVSNAGNSKTVYVAGESEWAYKLNFTAPTTAALGGDIKVTGTVKDAFGNDLTVALDAIGDFDVLGMVGVTTPAFKYTSSTKSYEFKYTAPTTAIPVAVQIKLAAVETPTAVTAFGTPVASVFFTVTATDLTATVTSLTAQVASLTAQVAALTDQLAGSRPVADSVTKKKYNTLARKWNAANPGAKVALKK